MVIRTPKELGLLVKDHRLRAGLSQAQLAAHVGVSRKWLIDCEAGKPRTDLSLVLRTLNALGIELDAREHFEKATHPRAIDIDAIVEASKRRRR